MVGFLAADTMDFPVFDAVPTPRTSARDNTDLASSGSRRRTTGRYVEYFCSIGPGSAPRRASATTTTTTTAFLPLSRITRARYRGDRPEPAVSPTRIPFRATSSIDNSPIPSAPVDVLGAHVCAMENIRDDLAPRVDTYACKQSRGRENLTLPVWLPADLGINKDDSFHLPRRVASLVAVGRRSSSVPVCARAV